MCCLHDYRLSLKIDLEQNRCGVVDQMINKVLEGVGSIFS